MNPHENYKKCPGVQARAENLDGVSKNFRQVNPSGSACGGQGDFDLISSAISAMAGFRCDDRQGWLGVGMAVHAGTGGSDAGLSLWDDWSRQSEKYRPGECLRQWRSFKGEGKAGRGGIGLGSLVHWADQDSPGWRGRPDKPRQSWLSKNPDSPQATPEAKPQALPEKPSRRYQAYPTAQAAIRAIESRLGAVSQRWEYLDAAWQPCGYVLRWDTPSGKTYRPVSRRLDGLWYCKAMAQPRPIYNQPDIRESGEDELVFICEGEKDCDAMESHGLLATTSCGGSQGARLTDWTPLAGRKVVICPDNDEGGQKYAQTVCELLQALNPPGRVQILAMPELGPKQSPADWLVSQFANRKAVR